MKLFVELKLSTTKKKVDGIANLMTRLPIAQLGNEQLM
jgi:hypothetical protein